MWKLKRASDQMGISPTDERVRVCAVLSFVFVRSMSQTAEVERVKVTFLVFFGLKSIKRHSNVLVYNFQAKDILQYGQKLLKQTSRLCSLWLKLPKQAKNNGSYILLIHLSG